MAKQHLSARLDAATVEALDAWARARGLSRTEAVEQLIEAGMADHAHGDDVDQGDHGGEVELLRAWLEDARAQVAKKDEQIDRLTAALGNAQALQAAAEARALKAADEAAGAAESDGEDVLDQEAEDAASGVVETPQDATGAVLSVDAGEDDRTVEDGPERRLTWRERLARWLLGE